MNLSPESITLNKTKSHMIDFAFATTATFVGVAKPSIRTQILVCCFLVTAYEPCQIFLVRPWNRLFSCVICPMILKIVTNEVQREGRFNFIKANGSCPCILHLSYVIFNCNMYPTCVCLKHISEFKIWNGDKMAVDWIKVVQKQDM